MKSIKNTFQLSYFGIGIERATKGSRKFVI